VATAAPAAAAPVFNIPLRLLISSFCDVGMR
jgi:hypothetical protein